jgi:hypothetical protein
VAAPVTVYDADPQHLWNRMHQALWVRTGPDGQTYGHDRLDPLLWAQSRHLLEGPGHAQALRVLDEFLASHGEKLATDPLRRAVLQRDLWALFDWAAGPGENTQEAYQQRPPEPRRALLRRLARCIQRLALPGATIQGLPDTYAAAVASRAFAGQYDPAGRRPFLPPDLMQADGPWVELQLDNGSAVTATRHVFDFGARTAFRVFLRLPEGRPATEAYLALLRDFPAPRVLRREPGARQETLVLNPDLPQFPAGTQAALVRQTLLIDQTGRITPTRLTEGVQLRVFRTVSVGQAGAERRDTAADQDFFEFTRRRALLFAGKAGGLQPLGSDEKDYATQLLALPHDELEDGRPQPVLRGCLGCHDRPGIHGFRSFTGETFPRGRFYLPDLSPGREAEREATLTAVQKRERFDWGLLQGLWEDRPGR